MIKVRVTFTRQAHPSRETGEPDPLATVEHEIKIMVIDKDGDLVLHTTPGNTIVFSADEWHAVTALKEA